MIHCLPVPGIQADGGTIHSQSGASS